MRAYSALVLAAMLCVTAPAFAQLPDTKGSRDHPLIPRYAGSAIIGYDAREYGELTLALGKSVADDEALAARGTSDVFTHTAPVRLRSM